MIIGIIILMILILYFFIPKIFRKKPRPKCVYDAIKYIESRKEGSCQKIPYTIIQTHKYDKITSSMKNAMMTIIYMNPEYEYKYFNNEDCRNYLQENFGDYYVQLFDSLVPGAYKADFFRICYMNKDGGVYIDSAYDMITPLRELIEQNDEFIASKDYDIGIANSFICSIPNHPISEKNVELLIKNISSKSYEESPLHITGPGALGKSYKQLYGDIKIGHKNNIKILSHEHYGLIFFKEGFIKYGNKIIFNTRFKNYENERTESHYSKYWFDKKVYK